MSSITRRDTSPATNTNHPLKFITTTVFANATAEAVISEHSGQSVPVAAIVGGAVAGMLLAIIVTAGWVYWGKSIKRKMARERMDTVRSSHRLSISTYLNTHNLLGSRSQNEIQYPSQCCCTQTPNTHIPTNFWSSYG